MNNIKKLRHPQFKNTQKRPSGRKPSWIRVKAPNSVAYGETKRPTKDLNLNTVCEEAACPNIGECWSQKHATVMILGEITTNSTAVLEKVVRDAIKDIGYDDEKKGMDYKKACIIIHMD